MNKIEWLTKTGGMLPKPKILKGLKEDNNCQARVERILKQLEDGMFESVNRPRNMPYHEEDGTTSIIRVVDEGYWISLENWQVLKKREGIK